MAGSRIHDIDAALKWRLEELACRHGRSPSAEAKLVMRHGVAKARSVVGFGTRLFSMSPVEFRAEDLVFQIPADLGLDLVNPFESPPATR
jgi:hypothetical protein